MVRVLQIIDCMGTGGIQSFLMNIYRAIDREKIQFDFLVHRFFDNEYEKEIRELGGRIFQVPTRRLGIGKNRKALDKFFANNHDYCAVHMHTSSLTYITPLVYAKKHGIAKRIIHSHNTKESGSAIHTVLHAVNMLKIGKVATDYYACSDLAADWFYGKNTKLRKKSEIIPNAIDLSRFEYNVAIREEYLEKYELKNKLVIGHVGRFNKAKNHGFLIDVFNEFLKTHRNAVLLLVGDGATRTEIEEYVKSLGIEESVVFLGNSSDVSNIAQTFDLFILPSLHEGFPVTMVEAQAQGLQCLVSDTITKTANITGNVSFLPLDEPFNVWVTEMERLVNQGRNPQYMQSVKKSGYDINDLVEYLSGEYLKFN